MDDPKDDGEWDGFRGDREPVSAERPVGTKVAEAAPAPAVAPRGETVPTPSEGAPTELAAEPEWIGRVIDERYRITRLLGEGGMGAVFVAEHLKLHKEVAFKVIRAELVGSDEVAVRFAREAIRARFDAGPHAHKVQKQAYFDGYVRALCDAGLLTHDEALRVVGEERSAA